MAHELAPVGDLPPDARQEQGALPPLPRMSPSRSGSSASTSSAFAARPGSAAGATGSRRRARALSSSASPRGAKRGSPKPACTAFAADVLDQRQARRRRADAAPEAARPCVSVTKVPRSDVSVGERRPSRAIDGAAPARPRRRGEARHRGRRAGAPGRRRRGAPRPRIPWRRRRSRRRATRPRRRRPRSPDAAPLTRRSRSAAIVSAPPIGR